MLIPKAPCAYFGSALRLFQKRLALISEAPCAYFGSASCLFQKRTVFWRFMRLLVPCCFALICG